MRQYARRRKRNARTAIARGDEPPDPFGITAAVVSGVIGAGASLGASALSKPKTPKMAKPAPSPLAGEDTSLKPGEKVNAINTSPQGLLDAPTTGRTTILGG